MAKDDSSNKNTKAPSQKEVVLDYRSSIETPAWVREAIETQLAIEAEDAKSAGQLGYMARALVLASMPYKDPKADAFTRVNGDFRLRIVAGYEGGIPYGIYPRFLMSWIATEAVRTQSPIIELGDTLSAYLRDVLQVRGTGGANGTITRVHEQIKRLFGAMITAQYSGTQEHRGFRLRNVMIAEELDYHPDSLNLGQDVAPAPNESALWVPQTGEDAGRWRSKVKLTENFFNECRTNPVPIDRRAYMALRSSPLAMDTYTWMTYRYSSISRKTRPIPWVALMGQLGSNYTSTNVDQAIRDFKRSMLSALKRVEIVYPEANFEVEPNGLVLLPSRTHVSSLPSPKKQPSLF